MAKLINKQSGQVEDVTSDQAAAFVQEGTHAFQPKTRVNVITPEGELVNISSEDSVAALNQGFKLESDIDSTKRIFKEERYKGVGGAIKYADDALDVAVSKAWAATGTGAVVDYAARKLNINPDDPFGIGDETAEEAWQRRDALAEEHQLAGGLGTVLGFGGAIKGAIGGVATGKAVLKGAKPDFFAAASKRLAGDIVTEGAGAVSKITAKTVAQRLIKNPLKTAAIMGTAGVVEGAFLAAPRVITEFALGDREAAGESLAMSVGLGGGLSALIGGGGALWRGAKELGIPGPIKNYFTQVFTGVPDEHVQRYIDRTEQINNVGARGGVGVKGEIDDAAGLINQNLDNAQLEFNTAKQEFDSTAKEARAGMQESINRIDLEDSIALVESQKEVKRILGFKAEDALNSLDEAGLMVDTVPLKRHMTIIADGMKFAGKTEGERIVAPFDKSSVDGLAEIRNFLDELPRRITGSEAKKLLTRSRAYIKAPKNAGEYYGPLDIALTRWTAALSDTLKEVPEYAAAMADMAKIARALENLTAVAGTPNSAQSFLRKAIKEDFDPVSAKILRDYAEANAPAQTGIGEVVANPFDFMARLEGKRRNLAILSAERSGISFEDRVSLAEINKAAGFTVDTRPEDIAALLRMRTAKANLDTIKETKDSLSKLQKDGTESVINRFHREESEVRNQLRTLAKLSGKEENHFIDLVDDYQAALSFDKARINGSRRTQMVSKLGEASLASVGTLATAMGFGGAAAFGPVGAALGAAAGGVIGAGLDIYGGQVLKSVIENSVRVRGILAADKSMRAVSKQIDTVGKILEDFSSGNVSKFVIPAVVPGMFLLRGNRESKAAQLDKLNDTLSGFSVNPDSLSGKIGLYTDPYAENGAPQVAAAAASTMAVAVYYLQNSIPKSPTGPNPFMAKFNYLPSDTELADFEQKLEIVQNPMAVLGHFANGSLTPSHMEALNKVYPKILKSLRARVNKIGASGKAKPLTYKNRVKLSMLIGEPIDESLNSINFFQQSFVGEDKSIDPTIKANVNVAEGAKTEAQRLA